MKSVIVLIQFIFQVQCAVIFAQKTELNYDKKNNSPMVLSDVKYWGYQIQGIENQNAVDSLVASHYDMLVLEPTRTDWSSDAKHFNTAEMVARLKDSFASDGVHRKLVVAYIDIGEAEDWRWYWKWSTDWDCNPPLPTDWPNYIIACDPDGWTGNYPVAYWDPKWKDIVIWGNNQNSNPNGNYTSIIDEVIKDGFDGIYLDWVEAFEDEDVMEAAQKEGKDPALEMISFIEEMRTYAKVRNPDFLIIQQNAASLCDEHPELFKVIDAIAQEAIWYDGDATDDWNDISGYDHINEPSLVKYYTDYLEQYLDAGLPVFSCEYALNYSDSAYHKSYANGYVPYVTRRSLGSLTTTPPPNYFLVNILDNGNLVSDYSLSQNYPNPFNPTTTIKYSIPNLTHPLIPSREGEERSDRDVLQNITLKVYDILGKEIITLVNQKQLAGNYEVSFDASELTSRVYFYRITSEEFNQVRKMILVK